MDHIVECVVLDLDLEDACTLAVRVSVNCKVHA